MPFPVLTAFRRCLLPVLLAAVLAGTGGCKALGWGTDDEEIKGSPEQIYQEARKSMRSGNYPNAVQRYELLEARYPFSEQAKQGQLDLIYAYYKDKAADSAIDQADQFIRENPAHPRVDYAHYIKGLVYFESGANWLESLFRADMNKRPPQEARKSFQSFQTLLQQYPKSPYAPDARQRMVYLRNRLADYEMSVAKYYMKRGAYVGAANRAKGIIENYDGAPAVDEALRIMSAAYRKLGLNDLAKTAENVRQVNANRPDQIGTTDPATGVAAAGAASSAGGEDDAADGSWQWGAAPEQAGRWEGSVGLVQSSSTDVDFEGGTTAEVESSLGFNAGFGYHFTDQLRFGSTFTFDQKDYSGEVASDDPDVAALPITGSIDTMSLMLDVAYTFLTGPVTPYVVGGIGWAWVDTNVATEPPEIGCWWHPWWGYICTSWQDTKTTNGLAYEAGVGLRYDINDRLAADGAYRMRWADFDNATGTPSFDTLQLQLVWKF